MLKIVASNRFKKDLRVAVKRHKNIEALNDVVNKLANEELLDPVYRDHSLTGNYAGVRECHIEPDWLLIYRTNKEQLELYLLRTGTHSDLF